MISYARASWGAAVLRPYTILPRLRFAAQFVPQDFLLARAGRIAQAGRRLGDFFTT